MTTTTLEAAYNTIPELRYSSAPEWKSAKRDRAPRWSLAQQI